jgi:hypothetical protein
MADVDHRMLLSAKVWDAATPPDARKQALAELIVDIVGPVIAEREKVLREKISHIERRLVLLSALEKGRQHREARAAVESDNDDD